MNKIILKFPCIQFQPNQTEIRCKETLFFDQIPWAEIYVLVSQSFRSRWQCSEYLHGAVKMTRKEKLIKHGKSKSAIHNWNAFHLSIMCCALSASGNCYRKNVAVGAKIINSRVSSFIHKNFAINIKPCLCRWFLLSQSVQWYQPRLTRPQLFQKWRFRCLRKSFVREEGVGEANENFS